MMMMMIRKQIQSLLGLRCKSCLERCSLLTIAFILSSHQPPDRPLSNMLRTREHDFELPGCSLNLHKRSFGSLTACLNLLICKLAFVYICNASCNPRAYTFCYV